MRHLCLLAACVILGPSLISADGQEPAPVSRHKAVEKALDYLRAVQKEDGSWPAGGYEPTITTKGPKYVEAVTSLCVMAFLSGGHTPGKGANGAAIEKGIRFVMQAQQENGLLASGGPHDMYEHGISTWMLAEVVGVCEGDLAVEVRQKLDKAVALTLRAQRTEGSAKGGWRYSVEQTSRIDSDMSVTSWQMLGLWAAREAGCKMPPEKINLAMGFVRRAWSPTLGGFRYLPTQDRCTITCTAGGILALSLWDERERAEQQLTKAGDFLIQNPAGWGQLQFMSMMFFTSQATSHLDAKVAETVRKRLADVLIPMQAKKGSWTSKTRNLDKWIGDAYVTATVVLALTAEDKRLSINRRAKRREK